MNTCVIGVGVTSGGLGYTTNPAVSFVGGGGPNAAAVANVVGGQVVSVSLLNAGIGYTNAPDVVLDPPPLFH